MVTRTIERLAERLRADPEGADAGMTLVEVMIASLITVTFALLLSMSMIGFMRAASNSRVLGDASRDALVVFSDIDKQVRFADAINFPNVYNSAQPNAARYVEFRVPKESSPLNPAVPVCYQWRFDPVTRLIQTRQWVEGATPSGFTTRLALAVDKKTADYPFKMVSADTLSQKAMQTLEIYVVAGNNDLGAVTEIRTSFVARNSSIISPTNDNTPDGINNGGSVCDPVHNRP